MGGHAQNLNSQNLQMVCEARYNKMQVWELCSYAQWARGRRAYGYK